MVDKNKTPEINPFSSLINNQVFTVTGQVGCVTLIIILAALFGGLWIDGQFNTKPLFTIILMVGSVPVSMLMLIRLVRRTTEDQKRETNNDQPLAKEENEGG